MLILSRSAPSKQDTLSVIRQPAELETLDAIWLIWPTTETGESVEKVTISNIEALIGEMKVVWTCGIGELIIQAKEALNSHFEDVENLTLLELPSVEFWARDMGPIFVETNQNTLAVADFHFDAWGYSDTLDVDTKTEEMYDVRVAELLNLPVISSTLISERGNREVTGKGILMTSESVELGRNPTMSKQEMEAGYKRLLGIEKTIWLKQGLVEDDHAFLGPILTSEGIKAYRVLTTNGHVDEFARFVNDSTILLAEINRLDSEDPISAENHSRIEDNYQILSAATDQDGNPFTIIRMPLPGTILTSMNPGDYVYEYIKTFEFSDGSTFPDGDDVRPPGGQSGRRSNSLHQHATTRIPQ